MVMLMVAGSVAKTAVRTQVFSKLASLVAIELIMVLLWSPESCG